METVRNWGIDAGRVVALLSIVALHSYPNFEPTPMVLVLWDQLPRFGVPFFFISSGYFLWPKVSSASAVTKSVSRVLGVFVFWVVVYNLSSPQNLAPTSWLSTFLGAGDGYHLWFLSALAVAIVLSSLLVNTLGLPITCVIAASLFVIGTSAVAYDSPLWTFHFGIRNGFYFGFPFVVMGMAIANWGLKLSPKAAAICFVIAASSQVAESIFARGLGIGKPGDFFFSTSLYGLSSFLLFSALTGPVTLWVGSLGKYVLGAFAVHVFFLWKLSEGGYYGILGWGAFITLTFVYSMAFAAIARQIPIIKRVVI